MTISAPTIQICCDDCGDIVVLLASTTPYTGVYEVSNIEARYAFWGGATLPDGKHRCKSCHRPPDRLPSDIQRLHEAASGPLTAFTPIANIIMAAAAYRAAEQDGTPRLWRGKALQDQASKLDDALEVIHPGAC